MIEMVFPHNSDVKVLSRRIYHYIQLKIWGYTKEEVFHTEVSVYIARVEQGLFLKIRHL